MNATAGRAVYTSGGTVEQARERIEEFVRRYGALVLAVAVGVLLALLTLRVLRALRVLAGPALIVTLLVVGWVLHGH